MNPRRRKLVALGSAALLAPCLVAAQVSGKVYRMGCLWFGSPSATGDFASIVLKPIRDLGYVEGINLRIDHRWAEGKEERFPRLAAELVALQPDIILCNSLNAAIKACQHATSTIPIVMSGSVSPVALGFVASLARPGGNITGVSLLTLEMIAKQVEILHAIVPKATRIAVLAANTVAAALYVKEIREAAKGFGLTILPAMVQGSGEFEQAFNLMTKQKVEAVVVFPNLYFYRKKLADLLLNARLPAIYSVGLDPDAGGLISYGANLLYVLRLTAGYVDKILKGAKPADLPVQQPTEFELVVNLKTAKALGITIPLDIMLRVDRVIE